MDALRIAGGRKISGILDVSGSKNASLPIMAAALLSGEACVLSGVPDLVDVQTMAKLLAALGADVHFADSTCRIQARNLTNMEAPYDLVRTMRASVLVLGPLLARYGRARVSLPGGCAIGARPIDQHLKGLECLGARVAIRHGYVEAETSGLKGAEVVFDTPTVTGTENLLLAASLAQGETVLRNAACEPEIADLAAVIGMMGAHVDGAGTETIRVHGAKQLRAFDHRVISDRIEFGTFLVAGALVGDALLVRGGDAEHQRALINKLQHAGAEIDEQRDGSVRITAVQRPKAIDIRTQPYPGFPTDMQAQFMALMAVADGVSTISETIFENRFMHVAELNRLGASIRVDGHQAIITGVPNLSGSTVMATDLRASAGLVLAALVGEGETVIRRVYHLDRGYERIGEKLRSVGASIERFRE
jgi:UDP-N-acetylglucosamine 1-carboxyvinyltransferase